MNNKTKITMSALTAAIVLTSSCGNNVPAPASPTAAAEETVPEETVTTAATTTQSPETTTTKATTTTTAAAAQTPHRTDEGIIGISDKDISDLNLIYTDNVRNDSTGKWQMITIANSVRTIEYALSAFNSYPKKTAF